MIVKSKKIMTGIGIKPMTLCLRFRNFWGTLHIAVGL